MPTVLWLLAAVPYWIQGGSPALIEALGGRVRTSSSLTGLISAWWNPADPALQHVALPLVPVAPVARLKGSTDPLPHTPREKGLQYDYGAARHPLQQLDVIRAHEAGYIGAGVPVVMLDAGFDSTFPATRHLWVNGQIQATYDFESGDHLATPTGIWPFAVDSVVYVQDLDALSGGAVVWAWAQEADLYNRGTGGWVLALSRYTPGGWRVPLTLPGSRNAYAPRLQKRADTLRVLALEPGGVHVWWVDTAFQVLQDTAWSLNGTLLFPTFRLNGDTLTLWIWVGGEGLRRVQWKESTGALLENVLEVAESRWPLWVAHPGDWTLYRLEDTLRVLRGTTQVWAVPAVQAVAVVDGETLRVVLRGSTDVRWVDLVPGSGVVRDTLLGIPSTVVLLGIRATDARLYFRDLDRVRAMDLRTGQITDVRVGMADRVVFPSDTPLFRMRGDPDVSTEGISGHGNRMLTLLAGQWAGQWVGTAPGVVLYLARTERAKTDFEHVLEEDFWVAGMEWGLAHGARVLSSSLGYGRVSPAWYSPGDLDGQRPVSSRAASRALSRGMLVVTAMGNTSHLSVPAQGDTSLLAPADARGILAMGGVDDSDRVVAMQGFGPTADGRIKPELLAPYQAEVPDTGGYVVITRGTSVATALAAGAVAVVWQAHPDWDAAHLREVLLQTARQPEGYASPNPISGWGILQAYRAIQQEPATGATVSAAVRLLTPYPNPFRVGSHRRLVIPYEARVPGVASLWIYRLGGGRVAHFPLQALTVGRGKIIWTPPASLGRGVYRVVLQTPEGRVAKSFTVE